MPQQRGVARTLSRLGYTNVRKYREGIQDWVEAGLPAVRCPGRRLSRPSAAVTLRDPRRSARAGVDAQETGRDRRGAGWRESPRWLGSGHGRETTDHLIGLLLGAEEDWPQAFEQILRFVGPLDVDGTDAPASPASG